LTPSIDTLVLSHWHCDHSGGILAFLEHRAAEAGASPPPNIVVDVHPDRPIARAITLPPTFDKIIGRFAPDPTVEEIEAIGATVEKNKEPHSVAGGTVFVSGEVPRVTDFEHGMVGAKRWVEQSGKGEWHDEPVSS
jgi:7,8-dihydropterin-6-yl-methyl-4-(beta-D-ribofuranosyl)aminobenzene 5'-phosphate synthase